MEMTEAGETQAFWLTALVAHAERRGISRRALLGALELDEGLLSDPMAAIPIAAHYDALEHLADALDDPDLGVALGRDFDASAGGAMLFVSATAATFGAGLRDFMRFLPPLGERYEIAVADGIAHLRFYHFGPPRPAHHMRAASFLVDLVTHAIPLADGQVHGVEGRLRVKSAARVQAVRSALSIPVEGGAPVDELRFHASALDLPSRDAHPAMHAFFADLLTTHSPRAGESTAERLRRLIDARLPDGPVSLSSLSKSLGLSARTLQRRLRAERTSTRQLVEERRLLRARRALESGRSMSEAAFEAGYSEASALHRALRRSRE